MQVLDLDALDRDAEAYDRAVAATAGIDGFCSSSAWVIPAARALMDPAPYLVLSDAGAYAAFAIRRHERRTTLEPFELSWALSSPLAGPDPAVLAGLAGVALASVEVDLGVFAGVVEGSPLFVALLARFANHRIGAGPMTRRHLASLDGGLDGFLARRPRELRKALRRGQRRAADAGVEFEHHVPASVAEVDGLYRRVRAIEARSWKGRLGTGLAEPTMEAFYRDMLGRLVGRGAARVTFARRGDEDLGFVLGARWGALYRGLQFGFDDDERALGLGNLSQLEVVGRLCAEGVRTYDLGTGGDYKHRWCEDVLDTVALIVASR